ncbi:MAG: hypothetical protein ACUVUQ_01940 [Thermodesulfovibrionales bacterium]
MNIWVKSELKDISELNNLLEKAESIKDGYIIKEEIEEVTLKRYSGGDIRIKDSFYSLIVFDENREIKITRDGKNLYFREISENKFDGAEEIKLRDAQERSYFLKGRYDKGSKKWWESAFSPEFDYPGKENEDIPTESRAVLTVKLYRDEEGEVKYFRFCGYEVVKED